MLAHNDSHRLHNADNDATCTPRVVITLAPQWPMDKELTGNGLANQKLRLK